MGLEGLCVNGSLLFFFFFGTQILKQNLVTNGKASTGFSIRRGCQQCNPISQGLFVLCEEVLACKIR